MIRFKKYDKNNILAMIDDDHVATIRNNKHGIYFESEEALTINELEQILTKMKELRDGKNNTISS